MNRGYMLEGLALASSSPYSNGLIFVGGRACHKMKTSFSAEQCAELLGCSRSFGGRAVGLDYAYNIYAYVGRVPVDGYPGEYLMFYSGPGEGSFYIGSRHVKVLTKTADGATFDIHILSARERPDGRLEMVFSEKGGARTHLQPVHAEALDAIPKNGLAAAHKR